MKSISVLIGSMSAVVNRQDYWQRKSMERNQRLSKPPRISDVRAEAPTTLEITWTTGETLRADVADWIRRFQVLQPLIDPTLFNRARVGWYGHSIEWTDEIELGADQLYDRCKEQAGEPSPRTFDAWMHRNDLSLSTAAEALGLSRRMVAYYRTGSRPIPKVVGLACTGWEVEQRRNSEPMVEK